MGRTVSQQRTGSFGPGICGHQRLCSPVGRFSLLLILAILFFSAITTARADGDRLSKEIKDPLLSSVNLNIHLPGDHMNAARLEKLARALIVLKAGDLLSEQALQAALQRLKDSGVFESIKADSEPGQAGPVALKFDLVPFRMIKRIHIEGQFPLFENEVLSALGLRVGNNFTRSRLTDGRQRLLKLLNNQGFIQPAVDLTVHTDVSDGNVALTVKISKRGYYRLKEVAISGNRHFSDSAIRTRMATWRASFWPGVTGRLIPGDLKRDLRDLVTRYRSSGFASVEVKHRVIKNDTGGEATVVLHIEEGPRYDVTFKGNRNFSDQELKKELLLFKKGYRHGFSLRRSIRNIREKYRRAGYPHVRVTSEVQDGGEAGGFIRMIRVIIDEGPVERVSALHFSGNRLVDVETLRNQMLTPADSEKEKRGFSPQVLEKDVQAIEALYRHRGFTNVKVKADVTRHADVDGVEIVIGIDEGVYAQVASIDIVGLPEGLAHVVRDRLQVRSEKPFRPDLMEKDKALIAALVGELGYPYVSVAEEVAFDQGGTAARVVYRVDPGARTRLDRVYIRGNFKTHPQVILDELELKPGDPFSLKKMLASQSNLRNLEILRDVRLKAVGLKGKNSDIVLVVNVGERKRYLVEMGGGYDTRQGAFGLLTVGNRNLWGSYIFSQLHLFASQVGYGGNLAVRKPNILRTRFSMEGRLFGKHMEEFNQSFGTETYGASIGVLRNEWYDFTFGAKAGYQRRRQFPVDDFSIKGSDFDPRNVADATVFLQYDTRDSFLRPQNGIYSQGSVNFSHGLDDDLDDFLKYRLDARYYWTPLNRLTLATAARGGYMDMYGSASSPADDQLFYLGGAADVRGFSENLLRRDPAGRAVGGRTMFSGTLEARIDVGYSLELVTFLDSGMVGHPSDPESRGGFRFSTGLGLNYITAIGPIGISYGYKLDRREGEDPGRIHFSIGYTF